MKQGTQCFVLWGVIKFDFCIKMRYNIPISELGENA